MFLSDSLKLMISIKPAQMKSMPYHSEILIQHSVIRNYSCVSEFEIINHTKHKAWFYVTELNYYQSKRNFDKHLWLLTMEEEEWGGGSRRPLRDKIIQSYTHKNYLQRFGEVWVRICFSIYFSFTLKPLLWLFGWWVPKDLDWIQRCVKFH